MPYSSSRAISGPPTRTPISPGTIRHTDQNAMLTAEPNSFMNAETPASQAVPWLRARHAPARPSLPNAARIEVLSMTA